MSYALRQNPAHNNNYTDGRLGNKVDKIVIHHAATTDFDGIGRTFQNPSRGTSAHYGVGSNGNVDQYVSEDNIAWHAGNWAANCTSVGIENVNSTGAPAWDVADTTFNTLVELVHNIAERHGLLPLVVGKNLFKHKDFFQTACPAKLGDRLQELADRVNGAQAGPAPTPQPINAVDQILETGSNVKFNGNYRVDDLAQINGIWQVRTGALCPVGFEWNDNGVPAEPMTEVAPDRDQRLGVGSTYQLPGTYKVTNIGQYQGRWMVELSMIGYKVWVDAEPLTEV